MKFRLINLALFFVIFFSACNSEENHNNKTDNDTTKTVKDEKAVNPADLTEIEGIYTKGGHDDSYIMMIELEESGEYSARFAYIEGMLPPPDYIQEIEFNEMEGFKADLDKMTFTSKNGNGAFIKEGDNISIIFNDKKDVSDEPLKLETSTEY